LTNAWVLRLQCFAYVPLLASRYVAALVFGRPWLAIKQLAARQMGGGS